MTIRARQYELEVVGGVDDINAVLRGIEDESVFDSSLGSVGFAGGSALHAVVFSFTVSLAANITYSAALAAARRVARHHGVRVKLKRHDGRHRRPK